MTRRDALDRARQALAAAGPVVALTGAGVSAASGVPLFRGREGLWKDYRPEELATPEAFRRDPSLVWEWYAWRRDLVSGCDPNEAHRALARWSLEREDVTLVTQNVDGLHTEALRQAHGRRTEEPRAATEGGAPPRHARPLELHGSLFRVRCTCCSHRAEHRGAVDTASRDVLPACPRCGELLRPDVVWFGEPLPEEVFERARTAVREARACLVVGTSAVVEPAASLGRLASRAGAVLVEVNPTDTPLTPLADVRLRAGAEEVVPELLGS